MTEPDPLQPDSPKRHSDPCAGNEAASAPRTAFAFSVPDLRGAARSSPCRRLSQGSAAPPRHHPGASRHRSWQPEEEDDDSWSGYRRRRGRSGSTGDRPPPLPSGQQRLRSFSVTSRGLVNHGDTVRARSPSVTSEEEGGGGEWPEPPHHRVLLLGGSGVGKTSLMEQFTTSESLTSVATNTQESLDGTQERTISLLVDGEESEVSCEDPNDSTFEVDESSFASKDAFLLVYSVTDRKSLLFALRTLERLLAMEGRRKDHPKLFFLVGNKIDLVRCRCVTREEGDAIAKRYRNVTHLEASVGFNHKVDELLVEVTSQLRLRKQLQHAARSSLRSRARGLVDRLLEKCDLRGRRNSSLL